MNRELCKPVRLPSYHKGMRLLYIASRENAEDEGKRGIKIHTEKFYLPRLLISKNTCWAVSLGCVAGLCRWAVSLGCVAGLCRWAVSLGCVAGLCRWVVSLDK